ncbi:MAG: molybdopterin-dependent oxidoreductase [Deferribacterales bacterium]
MDLSRRQFIMAAAAALTAISYSPEVFAGKGDRVVEHATHMGPLRAYVRDGKIIKIEAMGMDIEPVDLIKAFTEAIYSSNRIKYPCVRRSFLDGSDNRRKRGAEEFVRVSWKEALDLVAQSLIKTKQRYGNESIFKTTYARWAHPGRINQASALQGRMLGLFGGYCDTVGDYSAGAAAHLLSYIMGDLEVYSQQTSREVMLKNTEFLLMWGTDPFKTDKVDYQVPIHTGNEWLRKMRAKGTRIVSIDPTKSLTLRELKCEWVPIRAASDTAMILGMCHTLFEENLYNKKFIDGYTVGFDVFIKYLSGKSDGVPKNAKWAEKICGVKAEKIKELARYAVNHRTILTGSWACQRVRYGEQFHWSLVALGCMIGQIGLPGGGLFFNMSFCSAGTPYSGGGIPLMLPEGRNPVSIYIPASRMAEMLVNPGRTIDYDGGKMTYPNIKLIYSAGVTPIGHHPNINRLIEGFRSVDAVITHEPWWTPTAKYSDIVLPATTSFERNDIAFGSSFGVENIFAMKKIIEPLHEARDDFDIFRDISKRLGFEKQFTGGRTADEWIKWSFSKVKTKMSFSQFWEKGYIHFPPPEKSDDYVRYADYRQDPVKNHLRTPSGKIEIFSEKIASFSYNDCPGYPFWATPEEGYASKLRKKYHFQLITPHPEHRLHSQADFTRFAGRYKINGREPVLINKHDAKRLNIAHGELVEVYNDRGSVVVGAYVTDNIVRGVLAVAEGAWYCAEDPSVENTRCLSGQVNILTPDRPTSKFAQAISANTCLVAIKKLDKKPPRNRAYDPPVIKER